MKLVEIRRLLVTHSTLGGHVHVGVRMGTALATYDDEGQEIERIGTARSLAGSLTFRIDEWPVVMTMLTAGADAVVQHEHEPSERARALAAVPPYIEVEARVEVEFEEVSGE